MLPLSLRLLPHQERCVSLPYRDEPRSMPVTLTGFLICRSLEEADRVSELLPQHIRLSRAELGCVRFEVWRSRSDPVRYAVYELYTNRETFEAHQKRSRDSEWFRATQHIPRDYRITEH